VGPVAVVDSNAAGGTGAREIDSKPTLASIIASKDAAPGSDVVVSVDSDTAPALSSTNPGAGGELGGLEADKEATAAVEVAAPEADDQPFLPILRKNVEENSGLLVITVVSSGDLKMTLNWVENLRHRDVSPFVFCIDAKMALKMAKRKIPAALIPSEWLYEALEEWRNTTLETTDRNLITHFKAPVLHYLTKHNFSVVYSDVDVAWVKSGLIPYLLKARASHPKAFLFYTQQEELPPFDTYVSSGMYLSVPGVESVFFWGALLEAQQEEKTLDQILFNVVLNDLGFRNTDALVELEDCLFPDGFKYFREKGPCPKSLVPYTAQANSFPGRDAKERALRKKNLWFLRDDPSLDLASAT